MFSVRFLLYIGICMLLDESSDVEEPESSTFSTKEQYEIDWAHTWEKAGGVLALAENEAQSLLTQVFLPVP